MMWQQIFTQPFPDLSQRLVEGTSACGQEAAHTGKLFPHWGHVSQEQLLLWSGNWLGDGNLELLMWFNH